MSFETSRSPSQLSQTFNTLAEIYRNAGRSHFHYVQEQFDALPDKFRDKILVIIRSLKSDSACLSSGLGRCLQIDADSLPLLQTAIQRVAFSNFSAQISNPPPGYLGAETMLSLLADHAKNSLSSHEIKTILDRWVEESHQKWADEYLKTCFEEPSTLARVSLTTPSLLIPEPQWDADCEVRARITARQNIMDFVISTFSHHLRFSPASTLPPIFHVALFISGLTDLTLRNGKLEFLPLDIFGLKNLITLDLSFNYIRSLPPEISNLQALDSLNLSGNVLISLPPEIGRLTALETLNLCENELLTGLPLQILDLPSSCTIDLEDTGLSDEVLQRLREIVTAEGYHGPSISYSMGNPRTEERPMGELLEELFSLSKEPKRDFPNLLSSGTEKCGSLQSWLSRLSDTADYQKGGERQAALAKKVLGYMQQAETNPKFRDAFFINILGASRTCGDRVALSILKIGISCRLLTMDKQNLRELADFLIHTVWPVDMLEEIARNKIPALPFFDEIEVYLAYPIKLRERLGLKIDVENMLYFDCSALKERDIDEAADFVKRKQADRTASLRFLIENEEWEEVLKTRYPDEMQEIKTEADAETEAAIDTCASDEVYQQIQKKRLAKLIDLSSRSLSS